MALGFGVWALGFGLWAYGPVVVVDSLRYPALRFDDRAA